VVRDADLTLNEKRAILARGSTRLIDRGRQSWLKVKNPNAPAATRAMDGTF
jgi:hypothetical protein